MTGAVAFCVLVTLAGAAQTIDIPRPGDREFLVDRAYMVSPPDRARIVEACDRLLKERAIPVVVVTVPSLAAYTTQDLGMEAFARLLFNQWGIGRPIVNGVSWNRGILLLISSTDRKARIELGGDWDQSYNSVCQSIMDEQIIPYFRGGSYSGGIVAGVLGLDGMARGLRAPMTGWGCIGAPRIPLPSHETKCIVIGFGLLIVVVWIYSKFFPGSRSGGDDDDGHYPRRRTASFDDSDMSLPSRRRSSWGGSASDGFFSGGSFGGGSSGGGGATGSW
jgi:uncharacterized protein